MLTKLNNSNEAVEDQDLVRMLKRYQDAEFAEVYAEDPDTIEKFSGIFKVVC